MGRRHGNSAGNPEDPAGHRVPDTRASGHGGRLEGVRALFTALPGVGRVIASLYSCCKFPIQRAVHLGSGDRRMLNPAGRLRRNSGRLVLSGANLATVLAPFMADWNQSHILNDEWPSHARFHGVVAVGTPAGLGIFVLWHLWRSPADGGLGRAIAAAVPISYWGSFFPALLVPGTGVDDPAHRVGRIAGIP